MEKQPFDAQEKILNRIQRELEKKEISLIQKDYRKHIPAFIWFLKISTVIIVFFYIVTMTLGYVNVVDAIFVIISGGALFFGLYERKRWSWYFGLFLFGFGIISTIVSRQYLYSFSYTGFFILLYMHKDYLNRKMPQQSFEDQMLTK